MNLTKLWAIALAEKRIILGQLIYWLFILVAYVDAIGIFIVQGLAHATYSTLSPTIGFPAPRNAIFYIAHYYLIIFLLAVVFLSLDVRGRDARSRMLEILDSRPYSNVDLILGRFTGWFLCAWVPVVVLMFILPVVGWLLPQFHVALGGTVEPLALIGFAFYMALPAIAFTSALVLLITLLVRHRIVALVLSFVLIGGFYWLLAFQPFGIALSFDLMGTLQVNQPSEWVPSIAKFPWWLQRLGLLLLAFGFLFFAVTLHPRLDAGSRRWQAFVACIFTMVGVISVTSAYRIQRNEFDLIDSWRVAHEEKREQVFPDIVSMQGSVTSGLPVLLGYRGGCSRC